MSEGGIVDEEEVRRWFTDGRTYQFMVDTYARKYNKQVSPSLFGEFRRRTKPQRQLNDFDLWKREFARHDPEA